MIITVYDNICGEKVVTSDWAAAEREAEHRVMMHGQTYSGRRYTHYGIQCVMTIDKKNHCITIDRRDDK